MSENDARAQRSAALEEKRRKLDELKKRRERRSDDPVKVKGTANLDEYIDGLLNEPASDMIGTAAHKPMTIEDNQSATNSIETGGTKTVASKDSIASNVVAESAPPPPPKLVETITVSTQTDDFKEDDDEEEEKEEPVEEKVETEEADYVASSATITEEKNPKILSTEEVEKEISKQPFSAFITSASKKVERILVSATLSDLLSDYTEQKGRDDGKPTDFLKVETKYLHSRQIYECGKWTSTRDVTDLDWSPIHRELFLSTYHSAGGISHGQTAVSALAPNHTFSSSLTPRSGELQSEGLALIWSLTLPTRPEHIFTCGSPVTAGRLHPTDSTLVLGCCDSGQLVVWDARSGRLPVQKSALPTVAGASSKGHTHPICSMDIIEGGVS